MWISNIITLSGPVTNLKMQTSSSLPQQRAKRGFKIDKVVKPKFDVGTSAGRIAEGDVPGSYTFSAQFDKDLHDSNDSLGWTKKKKTSTFEEALNCPTGLPQDFLEESLAEFNAWKASSQAQPSTYTSIPSARSNGTATATSDTTDFMALDATEGSDSVTIKKGKSKGKGPELPELSLEEQNVRLRQKIEALQRVQRVTFNQLDDLRIERERYLGRDKAMALDGKAAGSSQRQSTSDTSKGFESKERGKDEMEVDEQSADDLTASAKELIEQEEDDEGEESTSLDIRTEGQIGDDSSDLG